MAEVGEEKASSSGEKSETRSSPQPSKDLSRYLVDKFVPSARKSKSVPFESIDHTIYKATANCLGFSTSENRLPLWIAALQHRYEIIGNAAAYKVAWEEEDNPTLSSKCEKITIRLLENTRTGEEEKLVVITVYVTTGRILVQGKKFEEWSKYEFPMLFNKVENLDKKKLPLSSPSLTVNEDFGTSLKNFFVKFITGVDDYEDQLSRKLKGSSLG